MNKRIILIFSLIIFMILLFILIFSNNKKEIETKIIDNEIEESLIKVNDDGSVSIYDGEGNFVITLDNSIDPTPYLNDPTFNPMP